jgi:hypothetical protein
MRKVTSRVLVAAVVGALAFPGAALANNSANADGPTAGSGGYLTRNALQAPINARPNLCGNSPNGVGTLRPAGC